MSDAMRALSQREIKPISLVQSNLFITDTKGTGISVRITEVSVLEK